MLTALLAMGVLAQEHKVPNHVFSVGLSLAMRSHTWSVSGQPVPAPNTGGQDTLDLGRDVRGGFSVSASYTRFVGPALGVIFEAGIYTNRTEQRCSGPVQWQPDPEQTNYQACGSAHALVRRGSLLGLQAGPTLRLNPGGTVQPFARLSGGIGLLSGMIIQTVGFAVTPSCQHCTVVLLQAKSEPTLVPLATASAGLSLLIDAGASLRIEARDFMVPLQVANGRGQAASGGPQVDPGWKLTHRTMFTFGMDMALDARHRRRY